jgi:hypothetical protein
VVAFGGRHEPARPAERVPDEYAVNKGPGWGLSVDSREGATRLDDVDGVRSRGRRNTGWRPPAYRLREPRAPGLPGTLLSSRNGSATVPSD